MFDPNPSRSIAMGGRSYPANAAGTELLSGLILTGDDAEKFERAGYSVMPMHVHCSARIASGEDTIEHDTSYVVAIDRNGAPGGRIESLIHLQEARNAVGIYNGQTHRSIVGYLCGRDIIDAHNTLKREIPGFECFAVMHLR